MSMINPINPNPHHVDDEETSNKKFDYILNVLLPKMFEQGPSELKETRFMDVRGLCENLALGYVRSNMGLDYEFVDFASQLVPSFSSTYGYCFHFNFFARQKTAPFYVPAELFFVEFVTGDPEIVTHCALVVNQPYYHGEEGRPPRSVIFHPNHEYCLYCDKAKDGSLERGFFLAPPLP
ncbi:uncharacterized protein LOC141609419 [Silene latifolia]|uniref:uncharacterized protein LOC141609419 n=1 Tax=Silene latifolia TaxID=37657 RepID=UPI003D773447